MFHERINYQRSVRSIAGIGLLAVAAIGLTSCKEDAPISKFSGRIIHKEDIPPYVNYMPGFTSLDTPEQWRIDINSCNQNGIKGCQVYGVDVEKDQYGKLDIGEYVYVDANRAFNDMVTTTTK